MARKPRIYVFHRCGLDRYDPRPYMPPDGTLVQKTQPYGCPKNGTMGHCYIADLDGNFLGLVALGSLNTKAEYARYLKEKERLRMLNTHATSEEENV